MIGVRIIEGQDSDTGKGKVIYPTEEVSYKDDEVLLAWCSVQSLEWMRVALGVVDG